MIEVRNVTRTFGALVAVDDLSFSVADGECVGFLGPNGAGKSTTLRMIAGVFPPTRGRVRVAGFDVVEQSIQARSSLGYFPEHAPYYRELSVEGYLDFVAHARRIARRHRAHAVAQALAACDLGTVRRRLIGQLSKGFRQRVGLAQALLGDPAVLILDEPTSGLDPTQVTEIRELILALRGTRTILFSSHVLTEVSQVAQRVVIIDHGHIIAEDAPGALAQQITGAILLRVRVDATAAAIVAMVAAVPGVRRVEDRGADLEVACADEMAVAALSRQLTQGGFTLLELSRESLSLEEVFLRLVRRSGRGDPG